MPHKVLFLFCLPDTVAEWNTDLTFPPPLHDILRLSVSLREIPSDLLMDGWLVPGVLPQSPFGKRNPTTIFAAIDERFRSSLGLGCLSSESPSCSLTLFTSMSCPPLFFLDSVPSLYFFGLLFRSRLEVW